MAENERVFENLWKDAVGPGGKADRDRCDCFDQHGRQRQPKDVRFHAERQDTSAHLVLYGSNLVRIPPEIGAMAGLEEFTPYTSHRLHWFPYELTRCGGLRRSTVSTRSLYGNFKLRPPFPELRPRPDATGEPDPGVWGATVIRTCSVCDRPIGEAGPSQVWISLRVATDVLPLLVNACSPACIQALPPAAEGYGSGPLNPP